MKYNAHEIEMSLQEVEDWENERKIKVNDLIASQICNQCNKIADRRPIYYILCPKGMVWWHDKGASSNSSCKSG